MCFAVEACYTKNAGVSRGSEISGRNIDVEEIRQIGGGRTGQNLIAEAATFVFNSLFNRKPMEFLKERGTTLRARGFADKSGSRVLNTL